MKNSLPQIRQEPRRVIDYSVTKHNRPGRRWYQFGFSIRDLLWLTVLAAVLTVWGLDHWRQAAVIQQLNEMVGPLQGAGVNRYYPPPIPSAPAPNPPKK